MISTASKDKATGKIIVIQIGQAGNQIGEAFLQKYYENSLAKAVLKPRNSSGDDVIATVPSSTLFRLSGTDQKTWIARAICVDTEPKVVRGLLSDTAFRPWIYHPRNGVNVQSGAGNNWAFAYKRLAPKLYEEAKRRIFMEVEHCGTDGLQGFLIIHGLAGGTGSGLSAYFTEKLKKEYPDVVIMNISVWPFDGGEVIVQNFNILLTLSKVEKYSDAVLLLKNETLHAICKERYNMQKNVSFKDLNNLVAFVLCGIFLPSSLMASDGSKRRIDVLKMINEKLCFDNRRKLLTSSFTPMISKQAAEFSSFKWESLLRTLAQMAYTDSKTDEKINWGQTSGKVGKARSNSETVSRNYGSSLLFLRGYICSSDALRIKDVKERAKKAGWESTSWRGGEIYNFVELCASSRKLDGFEKVLLYLSNASCHVTAIEEVLRKAELLLNKNAYVHWYEKYGVKKQDFDDCFVYIKQLIRNYSPS